MQRIRQQVRSGILRESNGLVVVLNGHSETDPAGQLRRFREEMIFADLEIITNRIKKVGDLLKKPRSSKQRDIDQAEHDLLKRIAVGIADRDLAERFIDLQNQKLAAMCAAKPTLTAILLTAYSSIKSQPIIHAISSPIVA